MAYGQGLFQGFVSLMRLSHKTVSLSFFHYIERLIRQLKSYKDLNFGHKLKIIKYYRAKDLNLERKTHLMARESAIQLVLQISLITGSKIISTFL